jgi:cell division protein FtsL
MSQIKISPFTILAISVCLIALKVWLNQSITYEHNQKIQALDAKVSTMDSTIKVLQLQNHPKP